MTKIFINLATLFILALPHLTKAETATNKAHLLGFRIGASLTESKDIITKELRHKIIVDKEIPDGEKGIWSMVDKEEEYERSNRKLFGKKPKDPPYKDEIWLNSNGHPQIPDATCILLKFKNGELIEISITINSGLGLGMFEPKMNLDYAYYQSILNKLESKYGTTEYSYNWDRQPKAIRDAYIQHSSGVSASSEPEYIKTIDNIKTTAWNNKVYAYNVVLTSFAFRSHGASSSFDPYYSILILAIKVDLGEIPTKKKFEGSF